MNLPIEMENNMKKIFLRTAALALVMSFLIAATPTAAAAGGRGDKIRVGLASSSSHNATGELACAHLQNNTGYGSGFRFGYYDNSLNFVQLGQTEQAVDEIAILKTQNMYYGYDAGSGKNTYSDTISSNIAVGCYHIQISGAYPSYEKATAVAADNGGFVAWIDGAYQVRVGAFVSKAEAESALAAYAQGKIVGTSAYGISVVKTGTNQILFQFDSGAQPLAVMPDVTGAGDVRTWFQGFKYRGGFSYARIGGGNLTVVNVLDIENYVKGVVCYEMGRDWPLEALKTQATCARTYALRRLNYHDSLGFDVCNSDSCQVYRGTGSNRVDYGPSDTSDKAVEQTAGQVIWYQNTLADTFYSSSHGGASESAYNVWGTDISKYPYLRGVVDPYEQTIADKNSRSSWTVRYTAAQLTARLQGYGFGTATSVDHLELTYSELGNVISVKICYTNGQSNTITPRTKPYAIRSLFGVDSIRFTVNDTAVNQSAAQTSTTISINGGKDTISNIADSYAISGSGAVSAIKNNNPYVTGANGKSVALDASTGGTGNNQGGGTVSVSGGTYVFNGSGWGHQVGMSQFGANAMARLGFGYVDICEFYYPDTRVGPY